jgi:hypothetical protein
MMTFKEFVESKPVYYRYIHRNGMGLMNNQGLNRSRLTDDEENELVDLLDFGLQQPRNVPSSIFAFTEEGRQQHARLLKLLKKASTSGVVMQRLPADKYDVIWTSTDGQVALTPKR